MYAQLIKAVARPVIKETRKITLKTMGKLAARLGECIFISAVGSVVTKGVEKAMDDAIERSREKSITAKEKEEQIVS